MAEEKKAEKPKIKCPGTRTMLDAPPEEVKCRKCGYETEIFADEPKVECPKCGADIFRNADEPKPPSCVEWCQFAEKCLGDVFDLSKIKKIGPIKFYAVFFSKPSANVIYSFCLFTRAD